MTTLENYAAQNQYGRYSKFKTLHEFNNHYEQAMVLYKDTFTKSEYIALNKLRKFAADCFGVAWCRIQKAVAGTHQDNLFGVSRSTFERMLRKAKKLNLITVINQERKNKWQKHNVYVFNRVEELTVETVEIVSKSSTIEVPENEKIEAPLTKNLSLTNKTKDKINTYAARPAYQEVADAASKKQKPTLRKRIATVLKQKNMTSALDELAAIAYSMVNKLCAAEPRISKKDAEDIAFNEFTNTVNSKSAKNVFAVFSARMRNAIALFTGQEAHMNTTEIALRQGKKVGVIPQWLINREEDPLKRAQLQSAKNAHDNYLKKHRDPKLPGWFVPVYSREVTQPKSKEVNDSAHLQSEMAAMGVKTEQEYFERKREEFLARLADA